MIMKTLYGAPGPTLAILLDDPEEHDFPCAERVLADLSNELAVTRPAGLPYSIAEIVAHLLSNARFNLALCTAEEAAHVARPLPDWPEVSAEGWPALRQAYVEVLAELHQLAAEESQQARVVFAATDDEPAWTVGYKLTCSVAKHAAYHMGQIVVLRRLLGV